MRELLTHFQKMQHQCVRYLEPNGYVPFDGKSVPVHDREAQDSLFINDMIYLLDGPEQRAAEAAHAAAIAKLEAERDALREALAALDCSDILGVAESCASGLPRWDHVSAKIDAARDALIRFESEDPLTAAAQSRIDAAWERHKAASPICDIPPPGWKCSRAPGHDGPCAATPTHTPAAQRSRPGGNPLEIERRDCGDSNPRPSSQPGN